MYYVTDLHLLHKIKKAEAKTKSAIVSLLQSIVRNMIIETEDIILIGGDVASDYEIYKLFI